MQSLLYGNRGLNISGGNGTILWDAEGKRYVDFFSGHGASLFGHVHPVLSEALEKAAALPWSTGAGMLSASREAASNAFGSMVPGFRVYWSNSGSEAIEAALKISALNRPGRNRILALRRGFHGRTLGALSLTFNPHYREDFSGLLFQVEHFRAEEIPAVLDENTAAVFIEPVQGEGGVHPLPPVTGKAISERCKALGALLVADEIQTGFGRCGAFIASGEVGLEPDIICLSKGVAGGLPVGVTLWRTELDDFPAQSHGSTAGGNPLVMAVALASINLLIEKRYPARAGEMGAFFRDIISKIQSPLIKEVRGMGILIGIEVKGRSVPYIRELQGQGLLALPAGPSVIRFLPPLVAEEEHFIEAARILEKVLRKNEHSA